VLGFVSAKRVFMWPQAKAKPCGLNDKKKPDFPNEKSGTKIVLFNGKSNKSE